MAIKWENRYALIDGHKSFVTQANIITDDL